MAKEINSSSSQPLIGYMALFEDSSEGFFVEALLIVDIKGYPVDYCFTDKIPLTPTKRFLYGKTLRHYIILEVCGSKLIENINKTLSLILVREEALLELRKNVEIPLLCLKERNSGKKGEVSVIAHIEYKEDLKKTHRVLEICKSNFNLTEPFERIIKILANPAD
ncbi:MAG: hypothetical protein HWN68_12435 [Desulfobacterales bacterium]|nr:hypothetical protein [Desulfobacterales bacterium]